jgi:hypothetical protein
VELWQRQLSRKQVIVKQLEIKRVWPGTLSMRRMQRDWPTISRK